MRLAFMGTPEFAVPTLAALLDSRHEVVFVITQPDKPKGRGMHVQSPPVKELALEKGVRIFQPPSLKDNAEILDLMTDSKLDTVIVVAYGKMIPSPMLAVPSKGFINIHASLLPDLRGASPINRAIMSGHTITGISIMQIDEGMDSGPLFLQERVPIHDTDDAESLSKRLSAIGSAKLLETLNLMEKDSLEAIPQEHSRATYAPLLTKEDGRIDWGRDPKSIHNLIRGLVPWPCGYTYMYGKMLKIMSGTYEIEDHGIMQGTLIREKAGVKIACSGGYIIPKTLQLEGKKSLDAAAFSCGLKADRMVLGT